MLLAYKGFSKIAIGLSSCIHLITAGWGILMCFTIVFCSKKKPKTNQNLLFLKSWDEPKLQFTQMYISYIDPVGGAVGLSMTQAF